jgi:hypothetical protein
MALKEEYYGGKIWALGVTERHAFLNVNLLIIY